LENGCETDFYELYWQHLMPQTTWFSLRAWVFDLAFRPNLPKRLRSVRIWLVGFLVAGIAGIAGIVGLGAALYLYLQGSPLWQSVATPAIFSVSVVGVLGWLALLPLKWFLRDPTERFFLAYVGDAVRYLTPDPPNIKARRDIRTAGLTLLRGLHEDELRRYERIMLVGHSLGSVIAYDLITWFWQERHHRRDLPCRTGKRETAVMDHADPEPGNDDRSPLKKLADPCSDDFAASQWSLGQDLRKQSQPSLADHRSRDLGQPARLRPMSCSLVAKRRFRREKGSVSFPRARPKVRMLATTGFWDGGIKTRREHIMCISCITEHRLPSRGGQTSSSRGTSSAAVSLACSGRESGT